MEWYVVLKFVHVLATIVWVGGVVTLALLNAVAARQDDRAAAIAVASHTRRFGQGVIGPAAGVTLLAGIATAAEGGIGFGALWLLWGLAGVAVSLALGATIMRVDGDRLLAALGREDDTEVERRRARLRAASLVNVLLLASVVWAMVAKPTL